MTIERLFSDYECQYSGYADISYFADSDRYIWAYTQPYKADSELLSNEIIEYSQMLEMTLNNIPDSKLVIALTMCDIFSPSTTTTNNIKLAIDKYNRKLYELSLIHNNLKIIDFYDFLSNFPRNEWIDWKYYYISQMAINPRITSNFSMWFTKQIKAIELNRKKCIVLDLDNTLWGGILGEDGISGVKVGQGYPAEAYLMFQQYLLELAKSGIILTVCSKNNLDDVRKMWSEHPSNLIKEEHLAAYRINWNNKADNIKEIAKELNIGLDSMVFIDDNPSERDLIKVMLPEVTVVDFVKQPYQFPDLVKQITDDFFKVYAITQEDIKKTEQYKANSQREITRSSFNDFTDYLKNLNMELSIEPINLHTIERAAQMTQKTNQFNLTTKRYTVSDINQLIESGAKAFTLSVKDKFGDSGISALMIINIQSNVAEIDTLLMSCRILGKHIEDEFAKYIINALFDSYNIDIVNATYIPTAKNGQTADFYNRIGGKKTNENNYTFAKQTFSYKESNIYKIKR